MGDRLFQYIETVQSPRPFGSLLDAGTGSHSLRWIRSLKARKLVTSWCAITADEQMRKKTQTEVDTSELEGGKVVIGNWAEGYNSATGAFKSTEATTLPLPPPSSTVIVNNKAPVPVGAQFDVIVADYLVGAMDAFSPFFQDLIFQRLENHLNFGGMLYVVGLQPIADSCDDARDVFCRVTKVRDACILLAGHRCYREYPFEWVERNLKKSGLYVLSCQKFPILYDQNTVVRQINVARSKLPLFADKKIGREHGSGAECAGSREPGGHAEIRWQF